MYCFLRFAPYRIRIQVFDLLQGSTWAGVELVDDEAAAPAWADAGQTAAAARAPAVRDVNALSLVHVLDAPRGTLLEKPVRVSNALNENDKLHPGTLCYWHPRILRRRLLQRHARQRRRAEASLQRGTDLDEASAAALHELLAFDNTIHVGEDIDFVQRLYKAGALIGLIQDR